MAAHARWASTRSAAPTWETLLDVDALAKAEGANWVYKGVACLPPEQTDCLLSLSDGGKDAVRVREYSIAKGGAKAGFVAGGFDIPEAKSSFAWETKDSLLIATDWGGDGSTLTESGYPFVIKRLKRGQALAQAVEVFRGDVKDVGGLALRRSRIETGKRWFGAVRAETFYHVELFHVPGSGRRRRCDCRCPKKASPQGIFADTLLADAGRRLGAGRTRASSRRAIWSASTGARSSQTASCRRWSWCSGRRRSRRCRAWASRRTTCWSTSPTMSS